MAGLNNLLSDTMQTTTTLPSWYDAAQQQVVGQGVQAYNQAPQMAQTVAQGAINQLQPGAANPFTQAQSSLQQIASGAANPWLVSESGEVTPNVTTPLGGLFAAQNQQLQQMMPNYTAPIQGANIATGNFGSLRGQTAYNKAMGDALAELNTKQMQAALQNQQTGVQGAAQLGNVAQQGINAAMNVGQAQQNAPFTNIGNLASLLSTINAPTTVSSQKQLSPLGQIAAIGNAVLGGARGLEAFGKTALGQSILRQLPGLSAITGGYSGSGLSANLNPGTYQLAGGGTMVITPNGYRKITDANGNISLFDSSGNPIQGAMEGGTGEDWDMGGGGGGGGGDTGGGGGGDDYGDINWDEDITGGGGGGEYIPPYYDENPAPDWSWDESYD